MSAVDTEQLSGYSLGMYSTWLWCRPFRLLFDAGEGVAARLLNSVFGIRQVFLSHGHLDHLGGLPTLVNIRNTGMGEHELPLTVYHPAGDALVAAMRRYIASSQRALAYELSWQPLRAGQRVEVDELRVIEPFATAHGQPTLTLGYRLLESRTRLRPELAGRSQAEIKALAGAQGREAVSQSFEHPLMVYGGDGLSPAPELLAGADLAVLEATFADPADRERPNHATVDEAVAAAAAGEVKALALIHGSVRYRLADMRRAVRTSIKRHGLTAPVRLLWRERWVEV